MTPSNSQDPDMIWHRWCPSTNDGGWCRYEHGQLVGAYSADEKTIFDNVRKIKNDATIQLHLLRGLKISTSYQLYNIRDGEMVHFTHSFWSIDFESSSNSVIWACVEGGSGCQFDFKLFVRKLSALGQSLVEIPISIREL